MRECGLVLLPAVSVALLVLTACARDGEAGAEGSDPPAMFERDGSREGEAGGEGSEGEESGEQREDGEHREGGEHGQGGEHGESGEHHDDAEHAEGGEGSEGEESGTYIGRDATWDTTRRGLRLRLSFDSPTHAFTGTVENTTWETVCAVRVEVHLSAGIELGPTERTDLAPGASVPVELPAGEHDFDAWTAHPEQSTCPGRSGQ